MKRKDRGGENHFLTDNRITWLSAAVVAALRCWFEYWLFADQDSRYDNLLFNNIRRGGEGDDLKVYAFTIIQDKVFCVQYYVSVRPRRALHNHPSPVRQCSLLSTRLHPILAKYGERRTDTIQTGNKHTHIYVLRCTCGWWLHRCVFGYEYCECVDIMQFCKNDYHVCPGSRVPHYAEVLQRTVQSRILCASEYR